MRNEHVANLLFEGLKDCRVGIIVDGILGLDIRDILKAVRTRVDRDLYVASIGYKTLGKVAGVLMSEEIESAVSWRNKPSCAGSILVFLPQDAAKSHSLSEFDRIGARDVSRELLRSAAISLSANDRERAVWQALIKVCHKFPLQLLEQFILEVQSHRSKTDRIPRSLWQLGLVCDDGILGKNNDPNLRIERNREAIELVGQLSEQSRRRMLQVVTAAGGGDKKRFDEAYTAIMEFFKRGQISLLKSLELETIEQLIKAGRPLPKAAGADAAEEPADEPGPPNDRPLRGRRLEESIADFVVSNKKDKQNSLRDFANDLRELYQNPGSAPENLTLGDRAIDPDLTDDHRTIVAAICHCCTIESWGGWFASPGPDVHTAFRSMTPKQFNAYNPSVDGSGTGLSFVTLLEGFDAALGLTQGFAIAFQVLSGSRDSLVELAPLLVQYPFLAFSVERNSLTLFSAYLDAYADLLALFRMHEAALHSKDPAAARLGASELLRLDVVHVKIGSEWKAVLTPLHPFYLWRYQEILRALKDSSATLTNDERKQLSGAISNLPQVLHFLVSTPGVEPGAPHVLPLAGALYELPVFENHTNRYLGRDGIESISTTVLLWLKHSPYTSLQTRIGIVDPPELKATLRELCDLLAEERIGQLVVDVYLVRNAENHVASRLDIDLADYDIIDAIRSRRLVFRLKRLKAVNDLHSELKASPVHVLFAFDQGEFELRNAPRATDLLISPLVVTYQYEYSHIRQRGTISPSCDTQEGLFGDFHFLVRRVADVPAGQLPRLEVAEPPNVRCINAALKDGVARWLSYADRLLTSYNVTDGLLLMEKRYGQREVGLWALPSDHTLKAVRETLAQFSLDPDPAMVREIFTRFAHVAATGWPSLLQIAGNPSKITNESRKAVLGTVLAAAWYSRRFPDALIATLDSQLARQWLLGRDDTQSRADLVAFRQDDEGVLHIEPIEVKSQFSDRELVVEKDKRKKQTTLSGRAIDQLLAMIQAIEPIFGGLDKQPMFTPARREALKYQLHRECFRDFYGNARQEYWYNLLKEAFMLPTPRVGVRVSGKAIHVRFEELGDLEIIGDSTRPLELIRLGTRELQALLSPNENEGTNFEADSGSSPDGGSVGPEESNVTPKPAPHGKQKGRAGPGKKISAKQPSDSEAHEETKPNSAEPDKKGKSNAPKVPSVVDRKQEEINELATAFRYGCQSFSIQLAECNPQDAIVGPNVVRMYFRLTRGQRLDPLRNVLDDIGREMKRTDLMISQIENSDRLALDVPRLHTETVLISEAFNHISKPEQIEELPIPIGVTPEGEHIIRDLSKMPHLLVAGTTGAGKTIFLYGIIASLLSTHRGSESIRLVLSTSKKEDFGFLTGQKVLEGDDVIEDAAVAINTLQGQMLEEASNRSALLIEANCQNIIGYNLIARTKMVPIVIVVDEFADLADQLGSNRRAKAEFYTAIRRIAQMGRNRGMHLVLCTQRPSAELIPSDIRSLMNCRVALRVNKREDSRMIIDESGAEQLQMLGDLLFKDDRGLKRALGYLTKTSELIQIVARNQ